MADIPLDIDRSTQPPPEERQDERSSPECADEGRRIRRKDILNLLNLVNFQESTIFVVFKHREYDETLSVRMFPLPCVDEDVECLWPRSEYSPKKLRNYAFDSLLLSDGQDVFLVKAELTSLDEQRVRFKLPDFGHQKSDRKIRRHACVDVDAAVVQNGVRIPGKLIDFSAVSFRIELSGEDISAVTWLNPEESVICILERSGSLVFSGECRLVRTEIAGRSRLVVLTTKQNNVRRYRARESRSKRHTLNPAPNVHFDHPLTGKRMFLQAIDVSSSGFSTEEFFYNSMLVPGLVIPEITIELGNRYVMRCRAQALYRNVRNADETVPIVRCGIVFLDMDIDDQAEFSALLHQSADNRMRVCNRVDMEELWNFFFKTGFIYPSKYVSIQSYKEEFKRTYEKLYLRSPSIARHFIFQDRGVIFGHMSMIRSYAETWLIHHHAADRSGYGMAGVAVLDQVSQYINEFQLHRSTHMDYVMCYYRQENRFPSRVFGGVARDVANPKGSSIDAFAYLHLPEFEGEGSEPYQILPVQREDMAELSRFYEKTSGGLSLDAMNLTPDAGPEDEIDREYERNGFTRGKTVFALKQNGSLKAVIVLSVSGLGLNLSNLTNCVHVFILNEGNLLPKTLFSGINDICEHYEKMEIPILAYPPSYLDANSISYEKKYILWVLNLKHSDGYFKSLHHTFRRGELGRDTSRPLGN